MASPSTSAFVTMPRAHTLTPHRKSLSTTAYLIHRLRHPLRMQRFHHRSQVPPEFASVCTESDERRSRVEDEWFEEPTSQGSPYELIAIENKGEYTEQRYGDMDVYWNSIMKEASPDEQVRTHLAHEGKRREKRNGRIFDNTEQLYQAYTNRPRKEGEGSRSRTIPDPTRSLDHTFSVPARNEIHSRPISQPLDDTGIDEDRFTSFTEKTSIADLNAHQAEVSQLTWSSALTQILASPGVEPSISSAIRARARSVPRTLHGGTDEVGMREVSMVLNFTYPIANARWSDTRQASDWPYLGVTECDDSVEDLKREDRFPNGHHTFRTGDNDDVSVVDITQSSDIDDDSLYRAPAPAHAVNRMPNSGSVLRETLDPEENRNVQRDYEP